MLGEKQRGGLRGKQCRRGTQAEFSVTQCNGFLKLGILGEKTSRPFVPGPGALKGAGFELWRGLTCRSSQGRRASEQGSDREQSGARREAEPSWVTLTLYKQNWGG